MRGVHINLSIQITHVPCTGVGPEHKMLLLQRDRHALFLHFIIIWILFGDKLGK